MRGFQHYNGWPCVTFLNMTENIWLMSRKFHGKAKSFRKEELKNLPYWIEANDSDKAFFNTAGVFESEVLRNYNIHSISEQILHIFAEHESRKRIKYITHRAWLKDDDFVA